VSDERAAKLQEGFDMMVVASEVADGIIEDYKNENTKFRARIEELEADVRLLRLDNERLRKELEMFPQNDFNPPDAFGMEGPP